MRTDFGKRETPSAPYVSYLVKRVKETGILIDKPKHENPKTVLTPENIAAVAESVCEVPSTSTTNDGVSTIEHLRNIIETNFA